MLLVAAWQARALAARATLAPNPTSGKVQLELRGLQAQGAVPVEVVKPLGQVLRTMTALVSGGTLAHALDLGPLPAGLYVVRVQAREGTIVKRVSRE